MHEMQKTDTPMVDALDHDKPQTLGAQMQDVGTQVKETVQAAGTQVYEQGRENLQDLNRTIETRKRSQGVKFTTY